MATAENWEDILRTNYTDLLCNITTEFGLFGELKKTRIFTPIALKSFTDCKDTTEKVDRMLRNLQKKDFESFRKFIDALKNSDQGHIVLNHLSQIKAVPVRPVMLTDCDSPHNRGVSDGMSECFKLYWNDLIADINFDEGLLAEVEKRGIVTRIQMNRLRDFDTELKRAEQMLSWLERGSERQFLDFCDALRANNQPFIVDDYLMPKMTERNIPEPGPIVVPLNPVKPFEVRRNPEGSPTLAPVPNEVKIEDIYFLPCTPEFLNSVQDKVQRKMAYRCESKPRGRALIMNNMYFNKDCLSTREGSDMDIKNLEALFKRLHFDTFVCSDIGAKEMLEILVRESREEHHKRYDMFVLFLLSHGLEGEIFGLDGESLKTTDIVNLFNGKNCPNLLQKPKLFFIQACQGKIKTVGVTACDAPETVQLQNATVEDDFNVSASLPTLSEVQSDAIADDKVHEMADMAIICATFQGYVAYRRSDTGSLFVQCLINALKRGAHETDLMGMITEAFNSLHELEMPENQGLYKQIGEKRDSLRRKVYLLP